jgi:hypothetical protein
MEKVFVSYRSTPYNKLKESGCRVILDEANCDCQSAPKCPVQDCAFKRAAIFANRQDKYNCYIVPPIYMLPPNTLLAPIDFYRHLPMLDNSILDSDIFVRFEIDEDSFWTSLEYEMWRRRSLKLNDNVYYKVRLDTNGKTNAEKVSFERMTKNEDQLYWRLIYYAQKENYHNTAWGRYANCFINVCPNCGEITLYSIAALKYLINNNIRIDCTHCGNATYLFHLNNRRRFIITYDYFGDINKTHPLSNDLVIRLLLDSKEELLNNIHLICMSHETFPEYIALVVFIADLKNLLKKQLFGSDLEMRTYHNGTIVKKKLVSRLNN